MKGKTIYTYLKCNFAKGKNTQRRKTRRKHTGALATSQGPGSRPRSACCAFPGQQRRQGRTRHLPRPLLVLTRIGVGPLMKEAICGGRRGPQGKPGDESRCPSKRPLLLVLPQGPDKSGRERTVLPSAVHKFSIYFPSSISNLWHIIALLRASWGVERGQRRVRGTSSLQCGQDGGSGRGVQTPGSGARGDSRTQTPQQTCKATQQGFIASRF